MPIKQVKYQTSYSSFYFHKALGDTASSVDLLYYEAADASGKTVKPAVALARGNLDSPLRTETNISWSGNASMLNSFAEGLSSGFNEVMDVYRSITQLYDQALSMIGVNNVGSDKDYGGGHQTLMVGGDSVHLKYQGCSSSVNIPSVMFHFINEDDTDFFLNRCKKLLMYVLPMQSSTTDEDRRMIEERALSNAKAKGDGEGSEYAKLIEEKKKKEKEGKTLIDSEKLKLFYKETPPGDFRDFVKGYTLKDMSGYFGLRMGYKIIDYLVPSSVSVEMSRSGSKFGADGKWRPHYVIVGVSFLRMGKIFSRDIYENMLSGTRMNYTGPDPNTESTVKVI